MITKEAWHKELSKKVAAYLDLSDPRTLEEFIEDGYEYSMGYHVEVPTAFDVDRQVESWGEVAAGLLGSGPLTAQVAQRLQQFPYARWVLVQKNPPTWEMELEGKFPFGGTEWDLFGFSSDRWRKLAEDHENPYSQEMQIKGEFQFQVRMPQAEVAPEDAPTTPREEAQRLVRRWGSAMRPPGFASYLSRAYGDFRKFLGAVDLEDEDQVARLLEKRGDLEHVYNDMNTAAREAMDPNLFPSIQIPEGLYNYVLTGEAMAYEADRPTEFHHGPHGP